MSLLGLVLFVQLAAIYFFNVIHKTGPGWKNGTAVHYVLYVDRMVTPYVARIRDYVPNWAHHLHDEVDAGRRGDDPDLSALAARPRLDEARAIALINMLHIAFGTVFVLGPFAWSAVRLLDAALQQRGLGDRERDDAPRRTARARWSSTPSRAPRSSPAASSRASIGGSSSPSRRATVASASRSSGRTAIAARAPSPSPTSSPRSRSGRPSPGSRACPGPRHVLDALFQLGEGRASRYFGLAPKPADHRGPVAALRRKLGKLTIGFRELLIFAFFVGAVNQAMVELWVVNRRIKVPQPEPMRLLAQKARFLQGWFMFSPNPVMDDGTIVVDAITVDGRHVDPFWAKEPNFDLLHAKSFGYDQIWSDYFNRMHLPGNSFYRDAMKEYMFRLPRTDGQPERRDRLGRRLLGAGHEPEVGRDEFVEGRAKQALLLREPEAQEHRRTRLTRPL